MRSLTSIILMALIILAYSKSVSAQTSIEDEYQMKSYFMVFLKAGPNRSQDSVTTSKLMEGHLNNIERLMKEKKMVLAGPFLDDGMYKGIFILDVATLDEAQKLLSSDPAIKAGRLDYEIHPWYGPGNIVIGKK